jgi:hypothetical protein
MLSHNSLVASVVLGAVSAEAFLAPAMPNRSVDPGLTRDARRGACFEQCARSRWVLLAVFEERESRTRAVPRSNLHGAYEISGFGVLADGVAGCRDGDVILDVDHARRECSPRDD